MLMAFSSKLLIATTIWQGTIGKSKIYISLPCDPLGMKDEKCVKSSYLTNGHYFYASSLQNIDFSEMIVSLDNREYKLKVIHQAKLKETFTLEYKNRQFKGFWSHKGKKLAVNLKKIEETEDKIKEKLIVFKRDKVEKINNLKKELVWIKEEHTGLKLFRLGNGFSLKARKKLNPLLDKMQTEDALGILWCSNGAYGTGNEFSDYEVVYVSNDILTLSHSSGGFCEGNAHPSFGTAYYVFDLHSGKKYELEDIVYFSKELPIHPKDYSEKWYDYVDVIRAKKLRELAFTAKNMPLKAMPSNDTYDPYDLTYWGLISWAYRAKGIEIFLNFCEADRCYRGDSFLIPFELLAPYKNKKFPYKF